MFLDEQVGVKKALLARDSDRYCSTGCYVHGNSDVATCGIASTDASPTKHWRGGVTSRAAVIAMAENHHDTLCNMMRLGKQRYQHIYTLTFFSGANIGNAAT